MSCKAGNKNHKERCKRYKQEGRRNTNKIKKQKKHEKRIQKFAKRKEEGKTYKYEPNPYKEGTKEYIREQNERAEKNKSKKIPCQIWDSMMRKVQNVVDKEKALRKMEAEKESKKNE